MEKFTKRVKNAKNYQNYSLYIDKIPVMLKYYFTEKLDSNSRLSEIMDHTVPVLYIYTYNVVCICVCIVVGAYAHSSNMYMCDNKTQNVCDSGVDKHIF